MTVTTPQRPPLSIIWIYAIGQLGWSLASYGVGSLLNYFYMPSEENGQTSFPVFIPQAAFFAGLTIIGLISFGGRILDAFIDPFVANLSDKSSASIGKRRFFMALAALPLAAMSFLMFYPLQSTPSVTNIIWLFGVIFVYYVAFAFYVIPYSTLIAELGHVHEDRLRISTVISVTWALGFLIGNTTPALQKVFENNGYTPVIAFQTTVLIFALIALACMLFPVIFLDEKRYAAQTVSHENFRESLKIVFGNRAFRIFSASYLLYWLSLTFIQAGIIYYITLLFGLEKQYATLFGAIGLFGSFIFYPFMAALEKRFTKKKIILFGFAVFCAVFLITLLPISGIVRLGIIAVLSAFPLAAFGIFPNTIVADIIHQNEQKTGKNQAAMFYAGAAFMMKIGVSLANLLFPSLLIFGKSTENTLGVQLTLWAAFVFCILGFWVFSQYELEE